MIETNASTDAEDTTRLRGLSAAEARARLARDGPNELPRGDRRGPLRLLAEVVREPMFALLIGAAILYFLLGETSEAAILCASVVVVIGLSLYQSGKAERALDALRDLASPRAAVVRDGESLRIPGREVVVGDIVLLGEGDRVPADLRVVACHDLRADESVLTGESLPVDKRTAGGDETIAAPGTPRSGWLYSGTLVVAGHATGEVVATGAATAMGRIGRSLAGIAAERSPTQREIGRAVVVFAIIGLVMCVVVAALYLATRGGLIDALLVGVTLAIANVPEEFPLVLTIFLALGAWRLARHQVLTRRPAAIETLGAVTVLCTDKTGTLTENRMSVAGLCRGAEQWTADRGGPIPPDFAELLSIAALASELAPFDPMEKAIFAARPADATAGAGARLVREYPLTPALLAHTHVWFRPEGAIAACKGAPEAIAMLCRLPHAERDAVLADARTLAASALRVIGVASAVAPTNADVDALPPSQDGFAFRWIGLIGFADPLREGIADAVADARAAGVRTIMLTGDFADTARAIGTRAGLDAGAPIPTGADLVRQDDATLRRTLAGHGVLARVSPELKLRVVESLKASGEVVAMTGDGVNDAPALKAAHVGVAMGRRGTDVAREAASIVLLDDNFVSIVRAIRMGRAIYDNIRRALRYVLAVHVPVTGIALLPLLLGGPLVFWPIHIVFLELVIDPACAIVFEREAPAADIMRRPPRPVAQHLLDAALLLRGFVDGSVALAAAALVYLAAWRGGMPAAQVAALTFACVVAGNIGLIAANRAGHADADGRPNRAFWAIVAAAAIVLAASLYLPALARVFHFAAPPVLWLLGALAAPWLALALVRAAAYAVARTRPVDGATRG